eukprot:scaffold55232_cov63-Phaeocystis_antarctica.AAC.1
MCEQRKAHPLSEPFRALSSPAAPSWDVSGSVRRCCCQCWRLHHRRCLRGRARDLHLGAPSPRQRGRCLSGARRARQGHVAARRAQGALRCGGRRRTLP